MLKQEHPIGKTDTTAGFERSTAPMDQELLWLLGELANELTAATTLEALQRILTRKLRWILDFGQCSLAVQSKPSDNNYQLLDITSPSKAKNTIPQRIPLDQGWSGKVIAESKPYFIADLAQLPPSVILPTNAGLGIDPKACSLMLLPLRVGQRTVGSLSFSSKTPGAYSTNWRSLASLLASQVAGQLGSVLAQEQTSLALKNLARSQAQLKNTCDFRERVIESLTEAVYTLDLEGQINLVNRRTAEITGYSVEALMGLSFLELFPQTEATQIKRHLLEIISNGVSLEEYDAGLIRKDGMLTNIRFSLAPLFVEGEIAAVVGTARENK